jgi:hypothetical protein
MGLYARRLRLPARRARLASPMRRAPVQGCTKILTRERPDVEGAIVGPKERERRLAEQRVDRSHRRRGGIRDRGRPRPWTRRKKDELVLGLALLFAAVILVVVPFVLPI